MTGYFEYHYRATTDVAGNGAGGFGTDGSELFFNASDDLGGGLKAAVSMGIAGADRSSESGNFNGTGQNSAVIGLDGFITIGSESLGTFKLGTTQPGDYLSGGIAGVAGYGWDGQLYDGLSNRDSVGYSKGFGPVKASFTYYEPAKIVGEGTGTYGGAGNSGTNQRKNSYGLTYESGPLAANLSFGTYDQSGNTATTAAGYLTNVYDLSAAYDFGVAKVGAGVEKKTFNVGTRQDTLLGVSFPVGALTLGAQVGQRSFSGVQTGGTSNGSNLQADASGNGSVNATAVTAKYALSKRTYVGAKYSSWGTSAVSGVSNSNQTDLYIGSSF